MNKLYQQTILERRPYTRLPTMSGSNSMKIYNFARGYPNRSLIPTDEMKEIFTKVASNSERLSSSLNYGNNEGNHDFLLELKDFLERQCLRDQYPQDHAAPDTKLFTTHGVSHGLDILCATIASPGDLVLVEKPTYFLVSGIFKDHKLRIETLPMNANGIDCAKLEERLNDGMRPKLIYLIPSHQNPSGRTLPIDDRVRLCQLAERFEFTILADEVYHLLDWRDEAQHGKRPARFSTLSRNALSVSSFTKIFGPGIRCGWIEGDSTHISNISKYGYIRSQGGCAPFVGNLMCAALELGISDKILQKLNVAYRDRVAVLVDILEQEPRLRIVVKPLGGYFIWIQLFAQEQECLQASDFLDYCRERGITFLLGDCCDPSNSTTLSQYARLCFTDLDESDLREGAELFVTLYRRFLEARATYEKRVGNNK